MGDFEASAVRGWAAHSRQHELARDYVAALDALERAIAFDPLQEDLQRAALRLQYLAGDRAGAIRRYERLRALLDEELGVPPMDETRELYDAIITDTLEPEQVSGWGGERVRAGAAAPSAHPLTRSPAHPLTPSYVLPFTGRAAELRMLRDAVAGRKLALIEGEPGIGKTRLAEAFIGVSQTLALVGAARELEQALPYQPIIEALRGLLAHPDWRGARTPPATCWTWPWRSAASSRSRWSPARRDSPRSPCSMRSTSCALPRWSRRSTGCATPSTTA